MRNSNRGAFGRRSGGTVTVIEESVHRSSVRKAKIIFWVVWVCAGLLTATVAASKWHPIVALLFGAATGLVTALLTAAVVIIWPVLRAIWWWIPEIALALGLVTGWIELASHTNLAERLGAVALTATPGAIGPIRRRIVALAWCLVTRHRLRTCFSEFFVTNRTGSLPFILWARPTPVGERVWLWLRPGLALGEVQNRADKIAVACWADEAVAEAASESNSAYVRMDIKRRDALTATITPPLLGLITHRTPAVDHEPAEVPTALDLPEVGPDEVNPSSPVPIRPEKEKKTSPASPPAAPAAATGGASDISDWL